MKLFSPQRRNRGHIEFVPGALQPSAQFHIYPMKLTKQDPVAPSCWSRPFPSSSLKYLDNSISCTFPELLCRSENPSPKRRYELFDDHKPTAPGLLEPKD